VLTLLANLNSRTTQPAPDPNRAIERVIRKPANSSTGVLSSLRTIARKIRHDLTSVPNENLSGSIGGVGIDGAGRQSQLVAEQDEEPGSIREDNPDQDDREPEHLV